MKEVYYNDQAAWIKKYKITQGSKVKVLCKVPSYHMGWCNTWTNDMDDAVGKVFEVLSTQCGYTGILLKYNEVYSYRFPYFVLKHLTNKDTITTSTPILVRDNNKQKWCYSLYSHRDMDKAYSYCTASGDFKYCIPYKGNEHLVGSTDVYS